MQQDSSAAIKKVLAGEKPTEKLAKEKKKGYDRVVLWGNATRLLIKSQSKS